MIQCCEIWENVCCGGFFRSKPLFPFPCGYFHSDSIGKLDLVRRGQLSQTSSEHLPCVELGGVAPRPVVVGDNSYNRRIDGISSTVRD